MLETLFATLTLLRIGIFGATHGWGAKNPPLPKICHTYPTMMKLGTVINYLRKIQNTYIIYIISNSFKFSWVFKDFFNKHCYNFDDVSKNGYPRPP